MTAAQDYIHSKLNQLKQPLGLKVSSDKEELVEIIFKAITSKKFRKYRLSSVHADNIRKSITLNVKNNEPIKATLVFGGYKLWRLDESPEVDWAELFSTMYYTNWMKPICDTYKAGVWFDFFSDDIIVPLMNNIPSSDTRAYQTSFRQLLDFLKPYQPDNLHMTLNRVGDQYKSYEEFEKDLEKQKQILASNLNNKLPELDNSKKVTLDLNVRTTPAQQNDPKWREKVQFIHDSYAQVSGRRPYYRKPDKLNIMTTPYDGMLSVGTTKNSIMKFWVGAGVLSKQKDSFKQTILSPNQLEKADYDWQSINLGIKGKNFRKIRVIK